MTRRSRPPPSSRRSSAIGSRSRASRPTRDPIVQLGLWSEAPEANLAAARTAFEQGDLAGAAAQAGHAASAWSSAATVGQGRAVSLGLLVLAGLLAMLLAVASLRRRRHAHPPAAAAATASVSPATASVLHARSAWATQGAPDPDPLIDPAADTVRHQVVVTSTSVDPPEDPPAR